MLEHVIISNLLLSSSFRKRVIKHLVPEHFSENSNLVSIIKNLSKTYTGNLVPAQISVEIDKLRIDKKINIDETARLKEVLVDLYKHEIVDEDWLTNTTETFTRDKSLYHAILGSIAIYENKDDIKDKRSVSDIPGMISKALSVSFSPNVGLDFSNADERWDLYNSPEERIPFRLKTLNLITNGGAVRKTINIINAPINLGKSMTIFSLGADYLSIGYNVAVFTMEMSELEVMKRIDANLLKTPINNVSKIEKADFVEKIKKISEQSRGKLKVKAYGTGEGNAEKFKQQIDDWVLYEDFKPDVIIVDYLGICVSSIPGMISAGSYQHLKQISVELRALAQWSNTVLWTAMQLNREGIKSGGSGGMSDMSESIGVPMTADFILLLQRTPEMKAQKKATLVQVKSRYGEKDDIPSFSLKLETALQRFEDDPEVVSIIEQALARIAMEQNMHDTSVKNTANESLFNDTLDFIKKSRQSFDDNDIKV